MKYVAHLFLLFSLGVNAQNLSLNMYADTLHTPFIYGVASGDPTPTSVQLWTYVEPTVVGQEVTWLVATDSLFTNVVASGTEVANADNGYTVKPVATGLQPFTHYYYRFYALGNSLSVTGRTLTAPNDINQPVRFGVVSCSSIFSGYFNAYRHMANNAAISAIIHLGDYIYDFVDEDEQIRITTPFPTSPNNLNEWRERHKYYLMDPDLRLARQMHPWIQTWDNHDFESDGAIGTRAFFEFTPTSQPVQQDSARIYRQLSYGVCDIFLTDMERYADIEEYSPGNESAFGFQQYNWLTQAIAASSAKWKIIGSPKMMTPWSVAGLEQLLGSNSAVLFGNAWDGYPFERAKLLSFIDSLNIDNVIILSGDSHFSQLADLPLNPTDEDTYDATTGNGSIAVEFLPTSVSRGNFDEMGYSSTLQQVIVDYINTVNPNHVYTELIQHGYGLLNVLPDSAAAQFVYCPILSLTDDTINAHTQWVLSGENHWKRYTAQPNTIAEQQALAAQVYPNPAQSELWLKLPSTQYKTIEVYNSTGQKVSSQAISGSLAKIDTQVLPSGIYYLVLNDGGKAPLKAKFVKE